MLNSDDFIAEERKQRDIEVKKLETKKDKFEHQLKQESEAKTVIEKLRTIKEQDAYSEEGSKSLDVASLKILYKWKHGKTPRSNVNKAKLLEEWNRAKNNPPLDRMIWTIEEQEQLDALKTDVLNIQDTQVGRCTNAAIDDAIAVLSLCSNDQLKRLKNAVTPQVTQELQAVTPRSQELQDPSQELQDATPSRQDFTFEQEQV